MARAVEISDGRPCLKLARSGGVFGAVVQNVEAAALTNLIDARLTVTGVPQAVVNQHKQLTDVILLVPSVEQLRVESPAPTNVFSSRLPIGELMQYRPDSSYEHRKLLTGVVTLAWPDRLAVQNDSGSIVVFTKQSGGVKVGDEVDVLGFVKLGPVKPSLEDAVVVATRPGEPVAPAMTRASRIIEQSQECRLVTIQAELINGLPLAGYNSILLWDQPDTVIASLPVGQGDFASIKDGSLLSLTGVSLIRVNERTQTPELELLLRSMEDVRVLAEPPPANAPSKLVIVEAGLILIVLAAIVWAIVLRRRMNRTEGRFAQAFEASPIPVAMGTRAEQRVLDVNGAFLSQFGYRRDEVVGRTLTEINLCPDAEFASQFQSDLRQRSSVRGLQCHLRSKDGAVRESLLSAEPIQLEGEDCLLFIFQDVSERHELMNQLRESQKMEAVGRLAGGIAHDFNNLLTIIRGNNELLKDSLGADPYNAEFHEAVTSAANRAADLTRQLLAFSSKQVMHRAAVNLDDLIRASTRMMHRTLGEDIDIVESLGARGALVDSDQGMLSQVILNLAVNARDAMPRGGELSVVTKVVELRPENLPEHPDARDGEFVRVSISDTGSGMDSETLSHIFEPFYTTKETGKGTGLGLSTVFGIVKQHQGWISVASRVGEGSKFEMYLPLAGRVGEEKPKAAPPAAALRGTETILLVEDDALVRNITSVTLSRHGYVVIEAFNAVEARGIWNERGAGIDLLLTDMVMPGGVSGWELVQGLQRENSNLKSVYFSGYSIDALDHGEDLFDGFNFLAKPFQTAELLKTIRARLDDKRPEMQPAVS